jgi:hypothetical protein
MSNQTSETCSTIYIVQMHIHNGPPPPRLQVPAVGVRRFCSLTCLISLRSPCRLCFVKLSDTSENGGGEPVPTLCECKPRPSTRLPTDESNLLIMLSLPPIPTLLPTPRILIVARSFVVLSLGANQGLPWGFLPPPPNFPGINCTKRNSHWMFCKHCHHQMYRITTSFLVLIMYLSKRAGPQKRGRNESAQ